MTKNHDYYEGARSIFEILKNIGQGRWGDLIDHWPNCKKAFIFNPRHGAIPKIAPSKKGLQLLLLNPIESFCSLLRRR